ncbi:MAG: hypothetical protein ACK5O2_15390 [Microthrixaceae bacterium]
MLGDPGNVRIWQDADVFVAFDTAAPTPANESTAFSSAWHMVGLLNGDDGFSSTRESEQTDHYAWGGILVRTARRRHKFGRTFTALETNEVTNRLVYPGSTGSTVSVPVVERVKVAFETRDGDTVRRLISAGEAEIVPAGDINENETDLAAIEFEVTLFPTESGEIWTVQPAMAYLP